jgi:hypothetical protein
MEKLPPKTSGEPPEHKPYLQRLKQKDSPSYTTLLRQIKARSEEQRVDPMWRATLETMRHDTVDRPLREALAKLLTHTLASGRDKISGREIFWRLRIPPYLEQCEGRNIARVLRSLGWVRVRYGPQNKRIWGWRWREWNVSHVKIDLNS